MRVLHQNRKRGQWVGGDQIKLDKIIAELIKLGVDVTFNDQPLFTPALLLQTYDIVHTWNFSMEWAKYQVWAAVKHKRKLVCSMTYHETDHFIPYKDQQIMLDALDAAIYETPGEIERVKRHMKIKKNKTYIVPNGIDAWWFKPTKVKVPIKDYALTVGRIETSKGQLETAISCKYLGIPYVCIGEIVDMPYADELLSYEAVIYPPMEQADLKRWYYNALIYCQVSIAETWGMAVDEAGSQGCRLLLSTGFERKDIPGAVYCNHANIESIRDGLQTALSKEKSDKFRNILKKRTWKSVAQAYLKIYKKIMV